MHTSPTDGNTGLTSRIEKLERENRRFKSIALLFLAIIAAIPVMAPSSARQSPPNPSPTVPEEIRARRFVVVDDTGRIRATLDTQNMGWPHLSRAGLTVYSADNTRRATVSSDNLLNQVSVENNQIGQGTRYARMQVGTEGVGLELSEFFLSSSRHNLFGVHWGSEKQGLPTLELSRTRPEASVRITPGGSPIIRKAR